MLKGFKDFVMRGNVVDLAVGVVIGAAFGGLVTQFTNSFVQPLINMVGAGGNKIGGMIPLPGKTADARPNGIMYGEFVSTLLAFALTAAVIYFLVVVPINKINGVARREAEADKAERHEELLLLKEIRDALVAAKVPAQPVSSGAESGGTKRT